MTTPFAGRRAMDWSRFLTSPWWTYDPQRAAWGDLLYRGFNLFEAGCWFVFAALVLRRWMVHRRLPLELGYAALFVLFGLTDLHEAWQQSAGLVLVKGIILLLLLLTRRRVMSQGYPDARLY